jgi:hypothetical protein
MPLRFLLFGALCACSLLLLCQSFPAGYNRDEAAVAPYMLADPITFLDGTSVSRKSWPGRRTEIVNLFEENVFGRVPDAAMRVPLRAHIDEENDRALEGLAIRKQITLYFSARGDSGPHEHLLLYLPAHRRGPVPMIPGLNFQGNHTVVADPGILLNPVWTAAPIAGEPPRLIAPDPATRGKSAQQCRCR